MIKLEAVNLDEKSLVYFQLAHHCCLLFTVVNSGQVHSWTIRWGRNKLFLDPGLPAKLNPEGKGISLQHSDKF